MKLSEAQKKRVLDWLESKASAGPQACPICQQTKWTFEDALLGMPVAGEKPAIAIPFVAIVCENCGHAHFFRAKTLGLDV